jgi:hypothetical protein
MKTPDDLFGHLRDEAPPGGAGDRKFRAGTTAKFLDES